MAKGQPIPGSLSLYVGSHEILSQKNETSVMPNTGALIGGTPKNEATEAPPKVLRRFEIAANDPKHQLIDLH